MKDCPRGLLGRQEGALEPSLVIVSIHTRPSHLGSISTLKRLLSAALQPDTAKCSGLRTEVQGQPQLDHVLSLTGPPKQPFYPYPCWGSWAGRNVTRAMSKLRVAWERSVLSLLCHSLNTLMLPLTIPCLPLPLTPSTHPHKSLSCSLKPPGTVPPQGLCTGCPPPPCTVTHIATELNPSLKSLLRCHLLSEASLDQPVSRLPSVPSVPETLVSS